MKRASLPLLAFGAVFSFVWLVFSITANAASPPPLTGVIIDWSTNTYAPAGFTGKVLPTVSSQISAWISIFDNGKPVNASRYGVRWYAGDQLLNSGTGITSISFKTPTAANQIVNLQARVQSPAGELTVANIQVPVITPQIAIVGNYPAGKITESPGRLTAIPYFFNVRSPGELSYQWTANGITAENAENPQEAVLDIGENVPSGTTIDVSVMATNRKDSTSATAKSNYFFQKI